MQDFNTRHDPLPVSRWARDDALGQISARDARGQVLMAINAGPSFAARLAAAFVTRPGALAPDVNAGWSPLPARRAPGGQAITPMPIPQTPTAGMDVSNSRTGPATAKSKTAQ